MISIQIPGSGPMNLSHVLMDYNGTIAADGQLISGVADAIRRLADRLEFHVITADTFGSVQRALADVPCSLEIIGKEKQDDAKLACLKDLGKSMTLTVGNGINDRLMLKKAVLGIAVMQEEGLAVPTMIAADIVVPSVLNVFSFLENPDRLVATLRN